MAKVEWSTGIDHVSGALSKPSKNGQHSCTKMLLGTHRVAPTESDSCNRVYLRSKVKRSTELSAKEKKIQTRFSEVHALVQARKSNAATIAGDIAAFKAQKDLANGKTTLNAWLWKVCGDEYDAAQG